MFLFKKIVGLLLSPLPLCLEIMVLGLVLLWFSRRQRLGKILVTLGTLLLFLLSFEPVSSALLRPLEHKYPPFFTAGRSESRPLPAGQVKYIVALGGGVTFDPNIPEASQLSAATLIRLVEAIRLHKNLPGTKLILSGGAVLGSVPGAGVMAAVAQALGVTPQAVVLESKSKDTAEQARILREMVGQGPFYLVTSAAHLPRAVALFRNQGLEPLPCPVGQMVKDLKGVNFISFFPAADNLSQCEVAFHEYLGMLWEKLKGQYVG